MHVNAIIIIRPVPVTLYQFYNLVPTSELEVPSLFPNILLLIK